MNNKYLFFLFLIIITISSFVSAIDIEISQERFGYGRTELLPINISNIVINASVNSSKIWDTLSLGALDDANTTQLGSNGGTLYILESWVNGLWCRLTGCTMIGDITLDDGVGISPAVIFVNQNDDVAQYAMDANSDSISEILGDDGDGWQWHLKDRGAGAGENNDFTYHRFEMETTTNNDLETVGEIRLIMNNATDGAVDSTMAFYTTLDSVSSEAYRINPSGNIGIGTTDINNKLTIANNNINEVAIDLRCDDTSLDNDDFSVSRIISNFSSDAYVDAQLYLQTATGENTWKTGLFIKDGNVDISDNCSIGEDLEVDGGILVGSGLETDPAVPLHINDVNQEHIRLDSEGNFAGKTEISFYAENNGGSSLQRASIIGDFQTGFVADTKGKIKFQTNNGSGMYDALLINATQDAIFSGLIHGDLGSDTTNFGDFNITQDGYCGDDFDVADDLDVGGDLFITQDIIHTGDTNTYIRATPDRWDFFTGGVVPFYIQSTASTMSKKLIFSSTSNNARIDYTATAGGHGSLITYKDVAGSQRGVLVASGGIIALQNRGPNGVTQMRANSASAGGGGETTTVQASYTNFTIYKDLYVDGVSTFNDDINQTSGNATINMIYGEMWSHNDTSFLTVDMSGGTAWVNITINSTDMEAGQKNNGFTYDTSDSSLTSLFDGVFDCSYDMSTGNDGNNQEYQFALTVNNVFQENTDTHRKIGAAGDVGDLGDRGWIDLNIGDKVQLQARNNDGTADLEIHAVSVNCLRIGNL